MTLRKSIVDVTNLAVYPVFHSVENLNTASERKSRITFQNKNTLTSCRFSVPLNQTGEHRSLGLHNGFRIELNESSQSARIKAHQKIMYMKLLYRFT